MTNASDNSPVNMPGKIFLIGFMGSGKTYWGKVWAQQMGIPFYDLDEIIETAENRSITEIFETEGEQYFRDAETNTLHNFPKKDNCIIACGGGAACFNDNMQWMNENGTTIYLSASPQYILSRVQKGKFKRPLISKLSDEELLSFIEQKLTEREHFYKQAQLILPVEELNENTLLTANTKP